MIFGEFEVSDPLQREILVDILDQLERIAVALEELVKKNEH